MLSVHPLKTLLPVQTLTLQLGVVLIVGWLAERCIPPVLEVCRQAPLTVFPARSETTVLSPGTLFSCLPGSLASRGSIAPTPAYSRSVFSLNVSLWSPALEQEKPFMATHNLKRGRFWKKRERRRMHQEQQKSVIPSLPPPVKHNEKKRLYIFQWVVKDNLKPLFLVQMVLLIQ